MTLRKSAQLSAITDIIKRMPWVVILLAQDEDAHTPLDTLVHPNMRIWVQVPKPRPTLSHPGLEHMYKCGLDVRPLPVGWDGMFNCLFFVQAFVWEPTNRLVVQRSKRISSTRGMANRATKLS